jgi:sugar O-acyltransferase (sialic acid O-acetyltransferase NeuD family)
MGGRLCLLGFSANTVSLIFNTLKALGRTQDLIIVENMRSESSVPYDCGLPHHRIWHEDYAWREGDTFFFAVGGARVKEALFDFFAGRFPLSRDQFVNLIHPSVQLAHQHHLDHGIHLEPGCIISPFADIAFGVSVLRGASIGHHTRVGEFTSISPGVQIAGQSRIGRRTTIGIGSVVFDHLSVGADCLIGGGSVVNKDLPDGVVAYGNPCRVVRERTADGV